MSENQLDLASIHDRTPSRWGSMRRTIFADE
jgi:hypothetical protein